MLVGRAAQSIVRGAMELGNRLSKRFPYMAAHRLEMCSSLALDDWLLLLRKVSSPTSDLGKTWGVKPVIAAIEPPRITIRKHSYTGTQFDPIFTGRILEHEGKSVVEGTIALALGLRIQAALCMVAALLLAAVILLSLHLKYLAPSGPYNFRGHFVGGPDQFVLGAILIVAMPAAAWVMHRALKKNFGEVSRFLTEFFTSKLALEPRNDS